MATWGMHMRIAEKLLESNYNLDEKHFLIGNIGPDCGVPNEDWSEFTPNTEISHWSKSGKDKIQADKFLEAHLNDNKLERTEKSFLIGYYVHLLTDIEFTKFIKDKIANDKNYAPLKSDPKFIWTIKKDWYDLDHKYFRDNPNNIFHRIFQNVKDFPDFLDYYPKGAVQRQVNFITNFYLKPSENLDRNYIYLCEDDMNMFINKTLGIIEGKMAENSLDIY